MSQSLPVACQNEDLPHAQPASLKIAFLTYSTKPRGSVIRDFGSKTPSVRTSA
jgi:hypothetical protein